MRYDGKSRDWVARELGMDAREIETAIRRGAEVYGHDAADAQSWVGLGRRPLLLIRDLLFQLRMLGAQRLDVLLQRHRTSLPSVFSTIHANAGSAGLPS